MTKEQANIFSYILTGMSLNEFVLKMINDFKVEGQDNNEVDNNGSNETAQSC